MVKEQLTLQEIVKTKEFLDLLELYRQAVQMFDYAIEKDAINNAIHIMTVAENRIARLIKSGVGECLN
jgi:hypothetical protein